MSKYTSIVQDPFADLNDHQAIMERLKALMLDVYDLTEKSRIAIQNLSQHNHDTEAHPDLREIVSANQRAAQLYTASAIHDHNISPVAHQTIFAELAEVRELIHNASNVDKYVQTTPASTTKAYITGTTASSTSIGDLIIDRAVYLDSEVGTVVATTFRGNLEGTATHAGTAVSAASAGDALTANLANLATSATQASYANSAGKVGTSTVGHASAPIYLSAGIPVRCGTSLAVSCTAADNATSAVTAAIATKVGSNTVGSVFMPIYLESGVPSPCTAVAPTDEKVKTLVANTSKAYLTGTKSATATTGTLVIDPEVYLDTAAGTLTAATFKGNLSGTATSATYAVSAVSAVSAGACTGTAAMAVSANLASSAISANYAVSTGKLATPCAFTIADYVNIHSGSVNTFTGDSAITLSLPSTITASTFSGNLVGTATSATIASNAVSAGVATKVGTRTVGNADTPVYISAGVPKEVNNVINVSCVYALSAGTTSNQAAIGTTTVGSPTSPVYIQSGIPTACNTSLSVSCSYANSAALATTANRATQADACTGNAVTASKLGSLTVGATNRPVYFSAGVPAQCGTSLAVSCSYAATAGTANGLSTSVANSLASTYTKYTSDIWVSPTGNDNNNGLTQSTPIKSFAKLATLLSIYSPYNGGSNTKQTLKSSSIYTHASPYIVVHLVAGTYTDNITLANIHNVWIQIHGQVTINGYIELTDGSNICLRGGSKEIYSSKSEMISDLALDTDCNPTTNTPKLTVNGPIGIYDHSSFQVFITLNNRSTASRLNVAASALNRIDVADNSHVQFWHPYTYENGTQINANLTYNLESILLQKSSEASTQANMNFYLVETRHNSTLLFTGSYTVEVRAVNIQYHSYIQCDSTLYVLEDATTFKFVTTDNYHDVIRVGVGGCLQVSGLFHYHLNKTAFITKNDSHSDYHPAMILAEYDGHIKLGNIKLTISATAATEAAKNNWDYVAPRPFVLWNQASCMITGYVYYDTAFPDAMVGSRVIVDHNCYFPTEYLSGVPKADSTANKQIPGAVYSDDDRRTPIVLRYPSSDTSSWSVPIIQIQSRDKETTDEWVLPVITYHHGTSETVTSRYMVNLEFGSTGSTYIRAGENGAQEFVEWHAQDANEQVFLIADGEIKFYPKWADKGYFNDDDSYIRMTPHFIPNETEKLNIGAAANRWNAIYAKSVNFSANITANAGTAALKSVTIADGGSIKPITTNKVTIGTSALRFTNLYINASAINGSDERIKDYIEDIPEELLDVWEDVRFYIFKFKDSIADKGDDARYHAGCIAQRIQEVCKKHGIDPTQYGFFCYDKWDATEAVLDEDGNILEPAIEEGELYSLRYEELLLIEAAYQRRKSSKLEEQVEQLTRQLDNTVEEMNAKIEALEAKYQAMYSYITKHTDHI